MRLATLCLGVILSCFCVARGLGCSFSLPIWSITDNSADPLYRYVENGKVGYIDNTGKVVIRPKFPSFGDNVGGEFHEGLLEVFGVGYVDTRGNTVIRKVSDFEFDFSEGLVIQRKPSLWFHRP